VTSIDAADIAFLAFDIVASRHLTTGTASWERLGATGETIKKDIAGLNIDLSDKDVTTEIRSVHFGKESAVLVDVASGGGDSIPEPFHYVFVVRQGEYLGCAGKVAG
jgi:hypothetical protein